MARTFLQLRRKTRRLIQEHTAGFWYDAQDVDPAINEAYFDAQAAAAMIGRGGDFQNLWQRNLQANISSYARVSNEPVRVYRRLSGDEYVDCNLLTEEQITRDADGNWTRWPDYPRFAVVERTDDIVVLPAPTTAVTNGLRCYLRGPMSLVADGDLPKLPGQLHVRLASGAAAALLSEQRTSDPKQIAKLQAEFDEFFRLKDTAALQALQRAYSNPQRFIMSVVPQTPGGDGGDHGARGWLRCYE